MDKNDAIRMSSVNRELNSRVEELEKELKQAKEALEACREDSAELLAERSWWKDEPRCGYRSRYFETMENILRADKILDPFNNPK
jgi:hypothetical protein